MRLDKFLKTSRVIKRRTLAKDLAEAGRIQVNGRIAKPSADIKEGDLIVIDFGQRVWTIRVEAERQSAKVSEAREMFTLIHEDFTSRDVMHHIPEA